MSVRHVYTGFQFIFMTQSRKKFTDTETADTQHFVIVSVHKKGQF